MGKKVVFKGYLYEDDKNEHKNDDIYSDFNTKGTEAISTEVTNQVSNTGIQAFVSSVQTQAANLGASGLIAIGSGATFQINHIQHHSAEAIDKATPMIQELVETGTIKDTIPVGHSKYGEEIPTIKSFFGVPVGEERNKTDEQRQIERVMTRSARPPSIYDEQEASMK
tara:strand:+ start:145 stop:648 length:504 start_codon:yes stop_codon:yes gene_type:complete